MAIKISGTTVIDNSQNITNAGIVTATSFTGDGSQLTNLPGGGGNTLEAAASGTLADGSKVIVNADGTVSVVTQTETTGAGAGSPAVFESATTYHASATYDSTNQKVIIAYQDYANSEYGTAIVGTVSGTSISFGTPTVFNSNGNTQSISAAFDSTNQKVVIAYKDWGNSGYGKAKVGTVSGTSISFGSETTFKSANSGAISTVYDSTNQKVVIAYCDFGDNSYGKAKVGTVSGTSISFGSETTFNSGSTNQYISAVYDSTNGKVVIAYKDNGNSAYGTAVVGTVSGTSISFGSESVFNAGNTGTVVAEYDSTNNKVVIAFQDIPNSDRGRAIVGTVSGTSISFGTPVTFTSNYTNSFSVTFNSNTNKVVISYRDGGNSYYGTAIVGTVSGTSISFGSPVIFESANTNRISSTFDSTNGKVVIAYTDNGNSDYGTAVVFVETGFPVHQLGSATVFESAANTWSMSSVYDPDNQKVVIFYYDNGNSDYGTAVVGTVSGTSITFGTPVVFNSSASYHVSAAYDSVNDKVVVAYYNGGNSGYGTAVIGTISGTSISFGTPVVFESATTYYTATVYDSTNQKVVIAYTDGGNSSFGTAIVGTVSGTSISFGSPTIFEYSTANYVSGAYDSANQKILFAFSSDNSSRGTAIVGTVSGNSISFGSSHHFQTNGAAVIYVKTIYDSANQKVVIAWTDQGNSNYGTAIVATISGTSISFGSTVIFEPANTNWISMVYDSTNGKVVIAYRDDGNSQYGTVIVGTVSGTSISFGSPTVFESARSDSIVATFDSTNNKVVIAYQDDGNSSYGTAVVFSERTISRNLTAENYIGISDGTYSNGQTATIQLTGAVDDAQSSLTPGQAYYVQNDGTLSETADNPSVFAGTALASTKLIVRG